VSLSFSSDGALLASVGVDERVLLWDVASRQRLGRGIPAATVREVAFTRDSKVLASVSEEHVVLWDVALESLKRRACRIANRNLTKTEWQQYLADEPYRKTCPELPEPNS
jgi:hypothetical protein